MNAIPQSLLLGRQPSDYAPATLYFAGNRRLPSKCIFVHYQEQSQAVVVLSHYYGPHGGTELTFKFEKLATYLRGELYPDLQPDAIRFFGHWPASTLATGYERINGFPLSWRKTKYVWPKTWHQTDGCPDRLIQEIHHTIELADSWREQHNSSNSK